MPTGTGGLARSERAALADELLRTGPAAPTLCAGWTTSDLAAHLVLRERRPLASAGTVLPVLDRHRRRVQHALSRQPFERLVDLLRGGPPRLSPFALPGVDAAANALEYFIHHEDVRRARDGWQPRELTEAAQRELWARLARAAPLVMRGAPHPVLLTRPDGARIAVGRGDDPVVVIGPAAELAVFAFGRQRAARVDVGGDPERVARVRDAAFAL